MFKATVLAGGYGESSIVQFPSGAIVIIDSFLNADDQPAPLEYLRSEGIDPSKVEAIVATHWHDDHISGITEVARACSGAKIWISTALQSDEFKQFLETASFPRTGFTSGVSELGKLLKLIHSSGAARLRWAFEGRAILPIGGSDICYCLSPSDEDVKLLIRMLNRILRGDRKISTRPSRNDASVVTYASALGASAIFGGDLEHRGHPLRGWKAVKASVAFHALPRAGFYKVAHHGSETGDRPYIWSHIIDVSPMSVIAPWNRGRGLPTQADVVRIKSHSRETFLAARPTGLRYRPDSNLEDKILRAANIKIERLPSMNFVEAAPKGGSWTLQKLGGQACVA